MDISDERICEVFNISTELYELSTMKYGCTSYSKDVDRMTKLPKKYQFDSKKYILWDTQYSDSNAQFAYQVMLERVPASVPKILKVQEDGKEPIFGIYVKETMKDE
jgi:hypothetical protein